MSSRVRADQAGEDPVSPLRRTDAARTHLGPGSTYPSPRTAFDAQTPALIQNHPAPTGVRAGPIQLGERRLVARPCEGHGGGDCSTAHRLTVHAQ